MQISSAEDDQKYTVLPTDLPDFLGKKRYNRKRIFEGTCPPGIVMGLAYTTGGGVQLYIESSLVKTGTSAIQMTGQMGDVMKEATNIAYSFAQRFLQVVEPGNKFFDDSSIHVHVPEGATPKDGPSAGITTVTALISLATGTSVRDDLAMTGEVTLTGRVLPIGGVKEKLIAAERAGVKHVILPKENEKDYDEIDKRNVEGIEVHFVSTYDEVYDVAFPS